MVEVKLTEKAYQQLKQSAQWWADNHSPSQARRWYEGFLKVLITLKKNPERFPRARENAALPVEMRELHFGLGRRKTHRAIFAIRHTAQDDVTADDL